MIKVYTGYFFKDKVYSPNNVTNDLYHISRCLLPGVYYFCWVTYCTLCTQLLLLLCCCMSFILVILYSALTLLFGYHEKHPATPNVPFCKTFRRSILTGSNLQQNRPVKQSRKYSSSSIGSEVTVRSRCFDSVDWVTSAVLKRFPWRPNRVLIGHAYSTSKLHVLHICTCNATAVTHFNQHF